MRKLGQGIAVLNSRFMRVSLFLFLFCLNFLEGAYVPAPSSLDPLRHQVSNQEIEIRTFERKLENLQTILEGVQEEVQTSAALSKNQLKDHSASLEMKVNALESSIKGLAADLQQLRTHANETTSTLQSFKKTLIDYEQRFKTQNQNMDHLTAALNSLVEVIQGPKDTKLYKIKSGDSLDKIAKANGTTVKELMKLNNLSSSDKIVIGKTLKLSE